MTEAKALTYTQAQSFLAFYLKIEMRDSGEISTVLSANVISICYVVEVCLFVCVLLCEIWKHVSEHFDVNDCGNVGWFIEVTGELYWKRKIMPDDANNILPQNIPSSHFIFIIYYLWLLFYFTICFRHSQTRLPRNFRTLLQSLFSPSPYQRGQPPQLNVGMSQLLEAKTIECGRFFFCIVSAESGSISALIGTDAVKKGFPHHWWPQSHATRKKGDNQTKWIPMLDRIVSNRATCVFTHG